uniref:Polo kinase n=1 Tax=Chelonoidis abingdonii TaxID=106734 RepID=A0A8C0IMC4_CHEAB
QISGCFLSYHNPPSPSMCDITTVTAVTSHDATPPRTPGESQVGTTLPGCPAPMAFSQGSSPRYKSPQGRGSRMQPHVTRILTAPLCVQGAFGRCYKFTDTSTGKIYAIKIVPQSRISRLESRGKVEREIELHSHLSHQHVVGFHRHFADRDNIYMILEYCSHKSLAHILKARKTLTEPEVRYYLRQIIAGLRYLHQQGIIHRDLKLSNFFLTKNMQVKIGDLGLATRDEQAGRRLGVVCGTPNYLAPEVIAKKGHSFQSDIWALGCILYTALTGCSPFEITHKQEMYQCIREGRYSTPNHLSPGARKLIGRLLAPSPSERPSLEEVLEHEFFTQVWALLGRASCSWRAPILGCAVTPCARSLCRLLGFKAGKARHDGGSCTCTREPHVGTQGGLAPVLPCLRKKATSPLTGVLSSCLENMPLGEHNPVQLLALPVLWVTRWVDYSNKYGFGYLLSDGTTGALLPRGFLLLPSRRVCYCPGRGEAVSFPRSDVPASLATKMGILHFFSQYMQQKLLELPAPSQCVHGGVINPLLAQVLWDAVTHPPVSAPQVNFYHDHTKLVLSCPGDEHLLTFIDEQHVSATFPLGALAAGGCAPALRERLQYTLDMAHCL